MLSLFKSLFETDIDEGPKTIDVSLAAAALMFEVVWADHNVDDDELTIMRTHLVKMFELSATQVDDLIVKARSLHDQSVGLHEFTSEINAHLQPTEKLAIIDTMWQISFADAQLDALEEHMIRRVSELLYVSHKDFIAAKLRVKQQFEG